MEIVEKNKIAARNEWKWELKVINNVMRDKERKSVKGKLYGRDAKTFLKKNNWYHLSIDFWYSETEKEALILSY